jgi:hypothetical protein
MFDIPPLTPALLEQLGMELKDCSFAGENQKAFLSATESRDVQAAPGNGKTTLLVAKLALLSRTWTSRTTGVCVISHTNAAREEVEKKLFAHPSASAFLTFPHFIGTVTAFIDRFVALPYLRGLGWTVQRIDDEVFAAVAGSRWPSKPALLAYSRINNGGNRSILEHFVSSLKLAEDFRCEVGHAPQRLKIHQRHRQPGAESPTGIALAELKAELVNAGFYRYADMTAIAKQALDKCPALIDRIRKRFPLVLLDEAQDTNGAQLALLDLLFGARVAYQRLGDQNQTLYEDEDLAPGDYWRAAEGVIPLNETKRFGPEIAAFVSRLTVRSAQQIVGLEGTPNRRTLILFDRNSIARVLPAYAQEVRDHWGNHLSQDHEVWAVASRHNPTRDRTGEWPKTLIDYCADYRSSKQRSSRSDNLCVLLRQISTMRETTTSPAEIVDLITSSVVDFFRHQAVRDSLGHSIGKRDLWSFLALRDPSLPLKLRRLMRDHIVFGNAAWEVPTWNAFCRELTAILCIDQALTLQTATFLEFVEEGALDAEGQARQRWRTVFIDGGVQIKLGSIHSVKGKTVDSILVLETEVYRGRALDKRAMDLATVLPHAFGLEDRDFTANVAQLSAATNVFVAATRPRQLLACAIRKDATTQNLLVAARNQGWHIRDVTDA